MRSVADRVEEVASVGGPAAATGITTLAIELLAEFAL
jgi:hypothetical protein